MNTVGKPLALVAAAVLGAVAAPAAVIINIVQNGADVLVTGSGSFDFSDLSLVATQDVSASLNGAAATAGVGQTGNISAYYGLTGPTSFGTINNYFTATSVSGAQFGVAGNYPVVYVPTGYAAGSMLSGTATYSNTNLAALGLITGSYLYQAPKDTLTVNISKVAAAPEVATWMMMLIGFGMTGFAMRRRRVGVSFG